MFLTVVRSPGRKVFVGLTRYVIPCALLAHHIILYFVTVVIIKKGWYKSMFLSLSKLYYTLIDFDVCVWTEFKEKKTLELWSFHSQRKLCKPVLVANLVSIHAANECLLVTLIQAKGVSLAFCGFKIRVPDWLSTLLSTFSIALMVDFEKFALWTFR